MGTYRFYSVHTTSLILAELATKILFIIPTQIAYAQELIHSENDSYFDLSIPKGVGGGGGGDREWRGSVPIGGTVLI